ncbi:proton-conducting transporter membrane subunit [Acidithiobacillus sp. IBUN Pt1247-S3]|uniref:proton-conducting transporter transmembrane domain-containing protein n=1 Tax=Acidithiobacillus sp. IBUN Pt1247-S3 TaxID=3166642 RepID=UPI0034E41540
MMLYVLAYLLLLAGPLVALLPGRRLPPVLAWGLMTLACVLLGIQGIDAMVAGGAIPMIHLALPVIGAFNFVQTPLGGLLILITAAVFAVTLPFVTHDANAYGRARRGLFLGIVMLTLAAMIGFFSAASIVSFMFCWEIAAIAIWGLITFETRQSKPVAAGLLTLALSELGSLAGLVSLLLLASAAGSSQLAEIANAMPHIPTSLAVVAGLLAFFGFGMKAGIIPLNVWLPAAHGSAPRSTSPILSGATLNLGLYAFLRIDAPIALHHPTLGLVILSSGALTALIGIIYALVEKDMKRLLAQSSVENMGIATAGIGAGLTFAAYGHPLLGGASMVAGLYHMINHSTFKTLLFLGAGGIDATTGTHDLDAMGGLMKRLPALGSFFLVGAFAIAALPPFNGFVSEWLLLESLLRVVEIPDIPVRITFALSGALLALTSGLALTCFILLPGSALMGLPRSPAAASAHQAPRTVVIPMGILAALCLLLGLSATLVIPALGQLAAPLVGANPTAALVPNFFHWTGSVPLAIQHALDPIGARVGAQILPLRGLVVMHLDHSNAPVVYAMSTLLTFLVLTFLLGGVWLLVRGLRHRGVRRSTLWDAGLTRLRPEMTYTATTFAAPVRVVFQGLFHPVVETQEERQGAFVLTRRYHQVITNVSERLVLHPISRAAFFIADKLARMHKGRVNTYASYILLALVLVLVIAAGAGGG